MSIILALTQAPHASYYNGGSGAQSREYWLRPTQRVAHGPRIAPAVAGMAPGEFRAVWADASGGIFSVNSPENGAGYAVQDWTPAGVWDEATQQLIYGGLRIKHKLYAYSDVVGDWRELAMPPSLARYSGTGHYYGWITGTQDGTVIFKGVEWDPETETYSTPIATAPGGSGNNGTMYGWSDTAHGGEGGLIQYGGDGQNLRIWRRSTNSWPVFVAGVGHGQHALVCYHPQIGKTLVVGGSSTATRTTLAEDSGAYAQVADMPSGAHMSPASWIVPHPAGCWLVRSGYASPARLYAYWPTQNLWEDVGESPDAALTYPVAAYDAGRELVHIAATTGLYAYKLPALSEPGTVSASFSGGFSVLGTVQADFAGGFEVAGATSAVLADFTGGFAVRGAVVTDFSGGYQVEAPSGGTSVVADFAGGFAVRGAVVATFPGGFAVLGEASATAPRSRTVQAPPRHLKVIAT